MKKNNLFPIIFFAAVSVVYAFPILENITYWGRMDWDQYTFWNAAPREILLNYHQFPLWNPFVNGGNVALAHTHSLFLSPDFLLILLFGPVVGVKLKICLYLFFGMLGMHIYSKQLGLSRVASYFPSIVYMFSSVLALHLIEGHGEYVHMAFMPWIFWSFQRALKEPQYIIGCIVLFAFMVLGGSIDILLITVLLLFFFAFFQVFQLRKIHPLKILGLIFIGSLLLSSIKLVPLAEFLKENPRTTKPDEITPISLLRTSLLSREQLTYYKNTKWTDSQLKHISSSWGGSFSRHFQMQRIRYRGIEFQYGFHEYGAYIGWIPLLLAAFGLFYFKQHWPLFIAGILSLWISLGGGAFFNLWELIHILPVYDSLRVPSRFIIGFIFCIALVSGMGLSKIEDKLHFKYLRLLPGLIVGLVMLDLVLVNFPILNEVFTVEPPKISRNTEFRQRFRKIIVPPDLSRSSMYPALLGNSGLLHGYEVLEIERGEVLTESDENYKGEAYLFNGKGEAKITHFSPNKIVVDVRSPGYTPLLLNQNYYNGWEAKKQGQSSKTLSLNGLIATDITPEIDQVTFYFLPKSAIAGSLITITTSIVLLVSYILLHKRRRTQ